MISCLPLGSELRWGPQEAQGLRLGRHWVPRGELVCCCPKEGVWVPGREKCPVFTAEAHPWNIWDWASHEWVSLNVHGAGFERCHVWTMNSRGRESHHAEREHAECRMPGSLSWFLWLSGSWSSLLESPAALLALGCLRYPCIFSVSPCFPKAVMNCFCSQQ